jgi:hypothetical protein
VEAAARRGSASMRAPIEFGNAFAQSPFGDRSTITHGDAANRVSTEEFFFNENLSLHCVFLTSSLI